MAEIYIAQGKIKEAAQLLGAAQAIREAISAPLPPRSRASHERNVAMIRTALGEDGFAAAWAEAQAMTQEQVVEQLFTD